MDDLQRMLADMAAKIGKPLPDRATAETVIAQAHREASVPHQRAPLAAAALGIPERYAEASLPEWHAETEAQARIRDRLRNFAARFAEAKAAGVNIVIRGTVGAGKTTLACATVRAVAARGASALYVPRVAVFFRAMREAFSGDGVPSRVHARYAQPDLLALDEVGMQYRTPAELQMLGELLDDRYSAKRPTILISNLEAATLADLVGERAADRLAERGVELVCDWPSFRRKRRAGGES